MTRLDPNDGHVVSMEEAFRRFSQLSVHGKIPMEVCYRLCGWYSGVCDAFFEAAVAGENGEDVLAVLTRRLYNNDGNFISLGWNDVVDQVKQAIESHADHPWSVLSDAK